jgi:restriction endonuclease S subunit
MAKHILLARKEATHGIRRIETQVLQNWAIPLSSLAEQKEIVRRVD